MRPDLIGPRPLRPTHKIVKGTVEWFAPFQTNEISKSVTFSSNDTDEVAKAIWGGEHSLQKAEGTSLTSAAVPSAKRAQAIGSAKTQLTGSSDIGRAKTQLASIPESHPEGGLPNLSHRSSVSEPGHKLAQARAALDHHASEYHRTNVVANDKSVHPNERAQASAISKEHRRLATNAQKVVNAGKAAGVEDTPKHHADMAVHYMQNKENPNYGGGVRHPLQPSGSTLARFHNPRSGQWDSHYGAPKEIEWENPDVSATYEKVLGAKHPQPSGGDTHGTLQLQDPKKKKDPTPKKPASGTLSLLESLVKKSNPSTLKRSVTISKAKVSKEKVMYAVEGKEECRDCRYFSSPYHCSEVAGKVSARGWCRLWEHQSHNAHKSSTRRLREDAAHSLYEHHYATLNGDHDRAKEHLEEATRLTKQAGAGPTKAMMKVHLDINQGEYNHSRKMMNAPGTQSAGGKTTGVGAAMHARASNRLKAAQQAMNHPLVGSKNSTGVQKAIAPVRADCVGQRVLLRKGAGEAIHIPHVEDDPSLHAKVTDHAGTPLKLHSDGTIRHPKTDNVHGTYSWKPKDKDGTAWLVAQPKKAGMVYEA